MAEERVLQKLSELIRGNDLIVAPVALNPIMARLAEEAGFKAVYMSGGSLGWYKCVTEANITLPEMAQVAVDMRAASMASMRPCAAARPSSAPAPTCYLCSRATPRRCAPSASGCPLP